jgi:Holliday junction resolvase RusA-like endonuclease
MTIQLIIPGEPMGKARARMTKTGFVYTPKKTVNYEVLIKELFIVKYPDFHPFNGPVRLNLSAWMKMPKTSRKRTEAMERGEIRPAKKPDISNILKSIEDGLNGLAYCDDKQIVEARIEKRYSTRPRIELRIEEIG